MTNTQAKIIGISVLNYDERTRKMRETITYNMLTDASIAKYPHSVDSSIFVSPVIIETSNVEYRTECGDWKRLMEIYNFSKMRYSIGLYSAFPADICGYNWINELEQCVGIEYQVYY